MFFEHSMLEIIVVIILHIILIAIIYLEVKKALKQKFCKHESYYEQFRTCHAICKSCKKELGFIGNFKNKRDL